MFHQKIIYAARIMGEMNKAKYLFANQQIKSLKNLPYSDFLVSINRGKTCGWQL